MDGSQSSLRSLEDQDESVRIAVKALGTMRNGTARSESSGSRSIPPLYTASSSYSSSSASKSPRLPSPSSSQSRESSSDPASSTPGLVSRMSHLPLVSSALWAYEQGKASSRVVKYGAEMMESSVKTISRPVIDRLPVNVNQLDEFAGRQLDRLDRYRRPSTGENSTSPTSNPRTATSPDSPQFDRDRGRPKLRTKTLDGSAVEDEDSSRDVNMHPESSSPSTDHWRNKREIGERGVPSWLEATSPFIAAPPPPPADARSSTPTGADTRLRSSQAQDQTLGNEQQQVVQRSRWQAVLLEAGGLSAALSEDSMRRLKYCLQWLQYATAHIDSQILLLRDFTANLQPLPSDSISANRRPPIPEEHMRKLTDVRRDIVHTVRQVVDVVSKYAGGALPEPARSRVRGFILKLPQRWASKAGGAAPISGVPAESETVVAAATGTGAVRRPGGQRRAAHRERGAGASADLRSATSSRAPSPSASPRVARVPLGASNGEGSSAIVPAHNYTHVTHGTAMVAAQKILTLATESLDMMRNVTGVVKESLDRADAWVGRLRTVGIQRGAQETEEEAPDVEGRREFDFSPAALSAATERHQHRHQRTGSSQSAFDDDSMHSPYLSGSPSISTAWGSSIPSTPGGSSYASYYVSAPSPGSIPLGKMSLGGSSSESRYNTPRSVAAGLPEEDEVVDGLVRDGKRIEGERVDSVKVVGVDEGGGGFEEEGERKMDVDV